MDDDIPLFADKTDDTKTAILKATFTALAEHGYADLTIDRIAQHFPKSSGLVFYHYDGKDDVLLDLLDYLLERFVQLGIPVATDGSSEARLRSLFEQVLPRGNEHQLREFEIVLTELRMRAAQDDAFQASLNQSQNLFREAIREIIEEGIESGEFKQTDPDQVADFLLTLVSGEIFERVTTGASRPIWAELDEYIEHRLLAHRFDDSSA